MHVFLLITCQLLTCCVCKERCPALRDMFFVLKKQKLSENMKSLLENLKRCKREDTDAAVSSTSELPSSSQNLIFVKGPSTAVTPITSLLSLPDDGEVSSTFSSSAGNELIRRDVSSFTSNYYVPVLSDPLIIPAGLSNFLRAETTSRQHLDLLTWNDDFLKEESLKLSEQVRIPKREGTTAVHTSTSEKKTEKSIATDSSSTEDNGDASKIEQILKILVSMQKREERDNVTKRNDLPCDVEGDWSSSTGGTIIKLRNNLTSTSSSYDVALELKSPVSKRGFLIEGGWALSASIPVSRSNVLLVTAANPVSKRVASFIGECRVCDNDELVTGNWLIKSASRDCKDMKATEQVLSDVWRREALTKLRQDRLKEELINNGHKKARSEGPDGKSMTTVRRATSSRTTVASGKKKAKSTTSKTKS